LETIEFRHWALPIEAEECARELVSLIRQAKESLLLGLYLFCKHTTAYPNTYNKIPAKLMDLVALPVTAVLQLLCSGQAYRILNALKKIAFSQSHKLSSDNLNNFKWIPAAAYLPHSDLIQFYMKHYW
jgi:hypothetical protein